ncbi:MAG: endonuclease/exonuclease/phosphatase family protein [Legionellales bacterium]|nr:endonuclease/exonuclease/phosphatase family protein [Legionellales bacterium]
MPQEKSLTIVTFNIHKGFGFIARQFNLQSMRNALHELNCDVVFLQEVQGEHQKHQANIENWPMESQFEYLADKLWPHYAYAKNAIYQTGHHGNAILSKYPFTSWENINLVNNKKFSRSLLHGVIQIPHYPLPIHVICFHLGLREKARKQQIQILSERIHSHVPLDAPLIIAGDSNDLKGSIRAYFDETLNLQEAHFQCLGKHAKTFPAVFPLFALDRVYYRGLTVLEAATLDEAPWYKLSDHLPLYTKFRLL